MSINLETIQDFMAESDREVDSLSAEMLGSQQGVPEFTPRMLEIVRILQSEPILCEPCLNWLQQTLARMAQAKLDVLFSKDEQDQLREKWGIE